MTTIRIQSPYPLQKNEEDSGYDIRFWPDDPAKLPRDYSYKLLHGEIQLFRTGIYVRIPRGYEGQIRPRSGLAYKHGITVLNTPGTIDAGYEGEVGVILINHGHQPFNILPNMRIAQLVFAKIADVQLLHVQIDDFSSQRGSGGFGSTGLFDDKPIIFNCRIIPGGQVHQDFSIFNWPGPYPDNKETLFKASKFKDNQYKLIAPGFGYGGDYGNGAIYAPFDSLMDFDYE